MKTPVLERSSICRSTSLLRDGRLPVCVDRRPRVVALARPLRAWCPPATRRRDDLVHQRVLGSHHHERRAEHGVGRVVNTSIPAAAPAVGATGKCDPRAAGSPDPVALHDLDLLGPVHAVQVVGQPVRVRGDPHHPLAQAAPEHREVAALGEPLVGDLLVGQDGAQPRAPVDRRLRRVGQPLLREQGLLLGLAQVGPGPAGQAVRQRPPTRRIRLGQRLDRPCGTSRPVRPHRVRVVPGVVDLQEDPLGPAEVVLVDGRVAAPVVEAQPQPPQLAAHDDHVVLGRLARVLAGLHGVLLGGQPERVVAQAVQDVLAEHPVEAGIHVRADVAQRVADVQTRPARVREHVEDDQLLAATGDLLGLGPRPGRVGRLEGARLLPAVLPRELDVARHRRGVAERGLVAGWGVGHRSSFVGSTGRWTTQTWKSPSHRRGAALLWVLSAAGEGGAGGPRPQVIAAARSGGDEVGTQHAEHEEQQRQVVRDHDRRRRARGARARTGPGPAGRR